MRKIGKGLGMIKWGVITALICLGGWLQAGPLELLMPQPKRVRPAEGEWVYDARQVRKGALAEGETLKPGAYRLNIRPDGVIWAAADAEGQRYAQATLRQLNRLGKGKIPCGDVEDWPSFQVRGMLHDTGRNWQPLAQLKQQLDWMADYKLNVFQWHITDNPGWRLQSFKYPQLSKPENLDRTDRFYTQAEFKELIAYAAARGITVIPELDVPGHTATFRRAFGIKRMDDPRVREIITGLFEELVGLLSPEITPYIHIGSDEVQAHERVPGEWLTGWVEMLRARGFRVVAWGPGQHPPGLKQPLIRQYWMGRQVRRSGAEPYIDSQCSYYINHVDPLELLAAATYQKPCITGMPENRLGAIFAVWHDDAVATPEDLLTMNPVCPAMVLYSDVFWNGREKDEMRYIGNLPDPRDPAFAEAAALEHRLLAHKPFFPKAYFPYWKQTDLRWRMAVSGDPAVPFERLPWEDRILAQGTLYPQHFFYPQTNLVSGKPEAVTFGMVVYSDRERTVPLVVDCMNYSRSDGRSRDAALQLGVWNAKGAQVLLNEKPVPPPRWLQPGVAGSKSREIPLKDEVWMVRPPVNVRLKKGRNTLRLILPRKGWKWSATCFFPETGGLTFEPPQLPKS